MEHHCGIFSVVGEDVGSVLINGLKNIQHRGYESAGISFYNDVGNVKDEMEVNEINTIDLIDTIKNVGQVDTVFANIQLPKINKGIGHVRYSTVKKNATNNLLEECQPLDGYVLSGTKYYKFSLVHNGNIPTKDYIQKEYNIDPNNSDTHIIVKLIEKIYPRYNNWKDTLIYIMNKIVGSYCFAILADNKIYAMRDRFGIRPLALGRAKKGYCIASETIAMQNYTYVRDINPGEIVSIDLYTFDIIYQYQQAQLNFCSFEMIYFMHHESIINGRTCEDIRYNLGFNLGKGEIDNSNIIENSIVVCLPNSSIPNAKGFADAIGKHYSHFIKKRKNMTRTFILPNQKKRKEACDKKFIFDDVNLKDQDIFVIDDSIVRGTTMTSIVSKLKIIGVKSIHLRITSPVISDPCYFGIDMSTKQELASYNKNVDEIKEHLGVDSLRYLSIDAMKDVLGIKVCTSCFTGDYNKELLDW